MLEEVDRLTRLVDGLLTLSRADAGQTRISVEPLDLTALAADVRAHLERTRRREASINRDRRATRRGRRADRVLLRQALINLLDNAIKYGPAGGAIEIRVGGKDQTASVEVRDTGPGIPPAHRERIFDRFYRVDQARSRDLGGVGLGLSIARWAAEINGGRLEYEAGHPSGSTFRITLPRDVSA